MFWLSREALDGSLLPADLSCGAFVSFAGRVRDFNESRTVSSLEYEAFDDLALLEGERVISEALLKFPITAAACVHRIGHLELGDTAIIVEVAAGHRSEAFEACRWLVDQVKTRVPIWKKEHYADGMSEWIEPRADDVLGF